MSPVLMALPGIMVKKKQDIPMYLYCLDLWPDSIKDVIPNEKNPVYTIVKWVSKRIYNSADLIGVTSKPFINYLSTVCNIDRSKMVYLPQHAQEIGSTEIKTIDNGVIDFVFTGNVGISQDLEKVVEAVSMMNQKMNFKIHIVGFGSELENLKRLVDDKQLKDKVVFYGRHPASDMPKFYRLADACLLTLAADNAVGLTIPGKLQGYMSAGKPIIGAINGAAQEVIHEAKCGLCVESGDVKGLASIMSEFINNYNDYVKCGDNSRKYYEENFSKDKVITQLESELMSLIEKK